MAWVVASKVTLVHRWTYRWPSGRTTVRTRWSSTTSNRAWRRVVDGAIAQASFFSGVPGVRGAGVLLPGVLSWNWPRATWMKRALSPFFWMSRRMALYSVAVGVLPVLDQSF